MRHDLGNMQQENKLKVCNLLRCKARVSCGLNRKVRQKEVNERGVLIIRLTLLMRRGTRSFKNATSVTDTFKNKVPGHSRMLSVPQRQSGWSQRNLLRQLDQKGP